MWCGLESISLNWWQWAVWQVGFISGCMADGVHFRVYGRWGSFQGVWQMEFISGCIADGVHFRVYGRWGSFRNAVT